MSVRHGEMKDVVLNTISIDEYKPKLGQDHEIIVVGFFVRDELAAYDFDDFVDKSTIEVLDSEVSPNPNQDGLWIIFIELARNPGFWVKLFRLVKDIENLTTPFEWKVSLYKQDNKIPLFDQQLRSLLITDPKQYIKQYGDDIMREHFQDSVLDNFEVRGNILIFEKNKSQLEFELVNQGRARKLWESWPLASIEWDPNQTSNRAFVLEKWLGSNWQVNVIGEYVVANHTGRNIGYVMK